MKIIKKFILQEYSSINDERLSLISFICIFLINIPFLVFEFYIDSNLFLLLRVASTLIFFSFVFNNYFYTNKNIIISFIWYGNIFFSLVLLPYLIYILYPNNLIGTNNLIFLMFFLGFFIHWKILLTNLLIISILNFFLLISGYISVPFENTKLFYYSILFLIIGGIPILKDDYLRNKRKKNSYKQATLSIAHEIRTPLASINILCSQAIKNSENRTFISLFYQIKEINNKCIRLIDFLVYFSRKNIKINFKKIDLGFFLIKLIEDNYKIEKDKKLIDLNLESKIFLHIDEIVLFHILNNLIKNAIFQINKFQKGKLTITLKMINENIYLTIRDTSSGIKPKILPYIFDEFFTTKNNNYGLGLYFSKKAIEAMEGKIVCRSIENQFTDFELIFKKKEREKNA